MEYPSKPVLAPSSPQSFFRSALSIAAFMALYYFLVDSDFFHASVIVFVLFIHELGHYLAMKKFGYQDVNMFFIPLVGAFVSGEKQQVSQRQKSIIILAGPVPGIVIGFFLLLAGMQTGIKEFTFMAKTFLIINAFNLIPVSPLDGGRLTETLFFSSKDILQIIFTFLSIAALAVLSYFLQSWILLIISLFLILQIRTTFTIRKIRKRLKMAELNYHKGYDELSDPEYWEIRKVIVAHIPQLKKQDYSDNRISIAEKTIIDWIKMVLLNTPQKDIRIYVKLIFILVWLCSLIAIPFLSLMLLYGDKL